MAAGPEDLATECDGFDSKPNTRPTFGFNHQTPKAASPHPTPKLPKPPKLYASCVSASKNLIGWPVDGVTNSPCHITVLPRTMVPTGHPVTVTPS
ncbi:MAG: hypothetical protein ACI9GK_000831 [Devosia sp.]|jgi:hypothetical protein